MFMDLSIILLSCLIFEFMPVGGQLFRSFREIATIHSREMVMNDMPAYVIL